MTKLSLNSLGTTAAIVVVVGLMFYFFLSFNQESFTTITKESPLEAVTAEELRHESVKEDMGFPQTSSARHDATDVNYIENDNRVDFQMLETKLGEFVFDGMDNWPTDAASQAGWFGNDANSAPIFRGQAKILPY